MSDKIELEEKEKEPVRTITIIGGITVVLNLLLGVSKIIIGKMMGFTSVFSDGIHGTGDVLTTIIAVVSVWVAARKKDNKYNYGHERWASIACIVLSVILFAMAFEILTESTETLIDILTATSSKDEQVAYSSLWWVSMILAIVSVVLKEIMFWVTMYGAKKAKSQAMKVDAWHQRIDALSSIAAIFALCGYVWMPEKNILDPIFSYPIVAMVIWVGVETFVQAAKELTDHAIDADKMNAVKKTLYALVPEHQVKLIRSRIFSEKFYLDIFLLENPDSTLKSCDDLADKIRGAIFQEFPDCKNVYVIFEPDDEDHRNQIETIR